MHNARTAFGVAMLVVSTGLCAGVVCADNSPSVSWPGVLKPMAPSSGTVASSALAEPAAVAPAPAVPAAAAPSASAPAAAAPAAPAMKEQAAAPALLPAATDSGAMAAEAPQAAAKPVAHKSGDSKARMATDKASDELRKEQLDRLAAKLAGGGAAAAADAPSAPTAVSSDK